MITLKQALEYEISASWWATLIPFNFLQDITARYITRKTMRRYARYVSLMKYKPSKPLEKKNEQL